MCVKELVEPLGKRVLREEPEEKAEVVKAEVVKAEVVKAEVVKAQLNN